MCAGANLADRELKQRMVLHYSISLLTALFFNSLSFFFSLLHLYYTRES